MRSNVEYYEEDEQTKYAWRAGVADGSDYGIIPENYETKNEYNEALKEAKYSWRKRALKKDTYGLDPNQFETEQEYDKAWQVCYDEQRDLEFKEWMSQHERTQ